MTQGMGGVWRRPRGGGGGGGGGAEVCVAARAVMEGQGEKRWARQGEVVVVVVVVVVNGGEKGFVWYVKRVSK